MICGQKVDYTASSTHSNNVPHLGSKHQHGMTALPTFRVLLALFGVVVTSSCSIDAENVWFINSSPSVYLIQ